MEPSTAPGLVRRAEQAGGAIHDARIAAIYLEHGVEEFWTVDRDDFSRFPDLRTRNPMIATLREPVATYAARRPKRR